MKYLIAGLGNIGDEYQCTRHNIGFTIVDALAQAHKQSFSDKRYAFVCQYIIKGRKVIIIKPTTYMNLSGNAIRYWLNKENIPVENLLVVLDDISLPFGVLRIKAKGGDAGHNGLKSIGEILATHDFPRLRFGIGNNFTRGHQVDYVLGTWDDEEKKALPKRIATCVDMIDSFILSGIEKTMNHFNNK